jgi:hypothetical protein
VRAVARLQFIEDFGGMVLDGAVGNVEGEYSYNPE